MSDALDKANAALIAARDLGIDGLEPDRDGLVPIRAAEQFSRLLVIARTQAQIACAEALERIADHQTT